jgi:hypothetical protein
MTFETRVISAANLSALEEQVPVQVWNSSLAAAVYGNVIILACTSTSGAPAGLWVCPVDEQEAARRAYRLLPYASPWIDPQLHPAVRRRVASSLLDELLGLVSDVDLPMDPGFRDVAGFLAHEVTAVFRHTRVLDLGQGADWRTGYRPSVRNHVRAARTRVKVVPAEERSFAFDRAVKGQDDDAVRARTASGRALAASGWPTFCLSAVGPDGANHGQVFVVRNVGCAILLHSWFDRRGPRGVPSLLVEEAIGRAKQRWGICAFDFEGSLLPSIDQFMAGFGAEAVGYAQLRSRPDLPAGAMLR